VCDDTVTVSLAPGGHRSASPHGHCLIFDNTRRCTPVPPSPMLTGASGICRAAKKISPGS
jgi:hypothetical protein